MHKPLLLYITDAERLGGAESYLETLLCHADRTCYRVALALPPRTATQALAERARAAGAEVVPLDVVHRDGVSPSGLLRSLELLRRLRPQVVHFVLNGPRRCAETVLASALLGVPRRVATFQLVTPIPLFRGPAATVRGLNRAAQFRTLHKGIAVSHGNARLLVEQYGFPAARLAIIPNSVDLRMFAPGSDGAELRAAWGIPPGAPLIGVVGRLSTQKGHRVLLAALPKVWEQSPTTHVVLVGAGELERELRQQAAMLEGGGRVHFVGSYPREQMAAVLAALDVFALPSLYEGLSFAVLEAMASARPIVATQVDGTVEALSDNQTGLLVPPNDAEALAAALTRLLADQNLRERLGRAARLAAEQHFDQLAMLRATYAVYER